MNNRGVAGGILAFLLLLVIGGIAPGLAVAEGVRERVWPTGGRVLDQGVIPKCVGSAWQAWVEAAPHGRVGLLDDFIYREAQLIDPIPGEDYEGTTTEAGAEVLRARGYIEEWRSTDDVNEMVAFLLEEGPIVLSMPWHTEDDGSDIEVDGYHTAAGRITGWHAAMCYGYREPHPSRDGFECQNSWGEDWGGFGGRFWLHERDVRQMAALGLLDAVLAEKSWRTDP